MRKTTMAVIAFFFASVLLSSEVCTKLWAEVMPQTVLTKGDFAYSFDVLGEIVSSSVTVVRTDTFDLTGGWSTRIDASANITVDGRVLTVLMNTTKYPKARINMVAGSDLASSSVEPMYSYLPHYMWDGINFLQYPGNDDFRIEYDHPNNRDPSGTSGAYYDAPTNEGVISAFGGEQRYHIHAPKWQLEQVKQQLDLMDLLSGGETVGSGIIAVLIKVGVISAVGGVTAVIAAIIALMMATLFLAGVALKVFIEQVMETEEDDGWSWLWGWKVLTFWRWTIGVEWWQSFGKWRDWGWRFVIPFMWWVFGSSSAGSARYGCHPK